MQLKFDKTTGLIPAVIQEAGTGKILMVGFMNDVAFRMTLETGKATFFSRSRNKLWVKGESSGHILKVHDVLVDCDLDTVLVIAESVGPGVCHEGYQSCFFRRVKNGELVEAEPKTFDPNQVYGTETTTSEKNAERSSGNA